ncbi:MAG: diaminopimelate epimerase, partial [Caldiserica bacterium]|nr:diaminopimelate epimerase [Caldisericota bacterium]
MKKIPFWKMEGGGNDFVVVDNRGSVIREGDKVRLSRLLLERKFGIGGDQLILVEKSRQAHFKMRIFNPDGSEAEMCGNGARCAARFAYEKGISPRQMEFETRAGIISGEVMNRKARVLLTPPRDLRLDFALNVEGEEIKLSFVNTGVPHVIREVENLEEVEVKEEGRKIRYHPYFQPQGTNVDFVKWDDGICQVRVYERGVEDETLCCGTGA